MVVNTPNWDQEPDLGALQKLHAQLQRSPKEAVAGLEALAQRGSVVSALYLADLYVRGGFMQALDPEKAKYWYSKANDNGYAPASYLLGRLCVQMDDYGAALAAFSSGASKGYAPSIYRLAKLYQSGNGTSKDLKEYKSF